ncbi:DUF2238 domain-containing protein [Catellatospora tritici]|uniref:DUF2238 domain-containing protein n=1 Tax=Catellatospora tritici TaxID=2851566 RepID=UPI001C2DCBA7|nr:DUF2238 domain-containing protein [Catellatospora tritici]MBV1852368.1 DUF2238 domain-containing protein [Catellatospora tritici]
MTPARTSIWLPVGHRLVLAAFALLVAASWWHPRWPVEQALHHSLTVVAVAGLLWAQHRLRLPLGSFALLVVFLALHTVAARWIYSYVPYDEWFGTLTGRSLSERFGWHRNHFDRMVHFGYGLLLAPVLVRLWRERGMPRGRAWLRAAELVLATGALYELFEWAIARTLAPAAAEAYNGQQGDPWDAHADMALALFGALLGGGLALLRPARPRSNG